MRQSISDVENEGTALNLKVSLRRLNYSGLAGSLSQPGETKAQSRQFHRPPTPSSAVRNSFNAANVQPLPIAILRTGRIAEGAAAASAGVFQEPAAGNPR